MRTRGRAKEEVHAWDDDIAFNASGRKLIGLTCSGAPSWIRFGAGASGGCELTGSAISEGGIPISVYVAEISTSIGSYSNSAALRLEPRGLFPLLAVLLLEEPPLGGVGDCEPETEATGDGSRG